MLILSIVDQINVTLIIIGETNYNNINLKFDLVAGLDHGTSQRYWVYETETKTRIWMYISKRDQAFAYVQFNSVQSNSIQFNSIQFNSIHNSILNSIRFDSIHMKNERD